MRRFRTGIFEDAIVDAILGCFPVPTTKKAKLRPPPGLCVDKAYGGTPEASPLRELLVAVYVYVVRGRSGWLHETTNKDFLADLAGRLLDERRPPIAGLDFTGCDFR